MFIWSEREMSTVTGSTIMAPAGKTEASDGGAWYAQHDGKTLLGDGREQLLLTTILTSPSLEQIRGSPSAVLAAIDEFGGQKYLMNVGPRKGVLMSRLISNLKPKAMVELGGYVGYSAILFGDAMKKAGIAGARYYSLECNPEYAAISKTLVDLAGLSDVVEVRVGTSDASLRELSESGEVDQIDLLFIDHYKPAYVHDLKVCEELKLVRPGSTVAADNVIHPGAPDYLAYVRSSVKEKREAAKMEEATEKQHPSNKNWYLKPEQMPKGLLATNIIGNPNLVYDTELIMSFEPNGIPDGIEISRCTGEMSP